MKDFTLDKQEPYPTIMGKPITRAEIIKALWCDYKNTLELVRLTDPSIVRYPDLETVLNYIERYGLPPKEALRAKGIEVEL